MIFAHGPWWSEFHHLLDIWPAIVAGSVGAVGWFKARLLFRDEDDDGAE